MKNQSSWSARRKTNGFVSSEHLADGKYSIKDLVDINRLRMSFEEFSKATGFTTGFVSYPDQEILISTGWRDACTKYHRHCPASAEACRESNIYLTACLKDLKELSIKQCSNGLVDGATPVIIRGKHLASVSTGQALFAPPDLAYFRKQAKKYGYDEKPYLAAIKQVPVVSRYQFEQVLRYLSSLAIFVAEEGLNALRVSESEKEYRVLFESSRDALMTIEASSMRFTSGNPAVLKMFGASSEAEFISQGPADLSPEMQPDGCASAEKARQMIETAMRDGSHFFEWTHRRIDGEEFRTDVLLTRIERNGNSGIMATVRDITERKRAEQTLRKSEEKYHTLFTNMANEVHFWRLIYDDEGRIKTWRLVDANPPTLKSWGKTLDEIKGRTADEIFGPGATDHYMAVVQKIMTEGVPYTYEDYSPNLNKHFRFTSVPLGEYFITTGSDITTKMKEREALRESEAQFRAMFGVASIGMAQADPQTGQWLRVNQKMCAITGYTAEEMLKARFLDITHPEDRKKDWEAFQRVVRGEAPDYRLEKGYIRKDGSVIWVNVNATVIRDAAGQPIRTMATIEDITERRRLEQEVLEISAREQRHIGQELHDDICQSLAGTEMLSALLSRELAEESSSKAPRSKKITEYLHHTLAAVRMLAHGLASGVIESEGLPGSLRQLAANAEEMFHIRCRCDCPDAVTVRNQQAALHVYRIAQEAITNALRHGGAREVAICVRSNEDQVSMLIRDDGCGIAQPIPQTYGMGLRTMSYRAGIIGATLEIRPGEVGGTEIVCTFPKAL